MVQRKIMVTGVGGCGKTTTLQLIERVYEEGFSSLVNVSRGESRIRDLFTINGFKAPSMVKGSNPSSEDPWTFLEKLVDWQMILCNLHTTNMSVVKPDTDVTLLDRSALDSLVYFVYDIILWGNALLESFVSSPEPVPQEVWDNLLQARIQESVEHLLITTHEFAACGMSTETYFEAVVDNVYETLIGRLDNVDELLGGRWNAGSFRDDICRRIAYILTQYVKLCVNTSGQFIVLKRNPHISTEEDGVRLTNAFVGDVLEYITDEVVRIVFDTSKVKPAGKVAIETTDPAERLDNVMDDSIRRMKWIGQLVALDVFLSSITDWGPLLRSIGK